MNSRRLPNKKPSRPNTGDEIIRGLKGLRDALANREPLPGRFTMRTVELNLQPRDWSPQDIVALRDRLHVSQSVFAMLLGTSVKTVQAWEQGNPPPPMARRLLECIEEDPEHWEEKLRDAARAKAAS